jgi:hypothetical protein
MTELLFDVESAHPDYTPNIVDYDHATVLFGAIIGHYSFTIKQGTDDSAYLNWNDGVANEWTEHYTSLTYAIGRLATLQACAESNFEKGFTLTPKGFVSQFDKFLDIALTPYGGAS